MAARSEAITAIADRAGTEKPAAPDHMLPGRSQNDRAPGATSEPRRLPDPVDARCQPREVASCAHNLVFRNVRAGAARTAAIDGVSSVVRLSCLTPITMLLAIGSLVRSAG